MSDPTTAKNRSKHGSWNRFWRANPVQPTTFLGYVLLPGGQRRLPKDNVRRFQNRLRGLRDRYRAGTVTLDEVHQRAAAWIAHAEHADTWRLRHAIFQGGMFDPALASTSVSRR